MKKLTLILLFCAFSLPAPDADDEDDDMQYAQVLPVLVLPAAFVYASPPAAQIIPQPVVAPGAPARRRLNF